MARDRSDRPATDYDDPDADIAAARVALSEMQRQHYYRPGVGWTTAPESAAIAEQIADINRMCAERGYPPPY